MSLTRFHIVAIGAWFATLVALLAVELALGINVSTAQILTLLLVGCVPAIVLMIVFRGAPRTISQVLYETEHASAKAAVVEKL